MQHTKVSEVQCFLEISCNRKISLPGLKRYPQNCRSALVVVFFFFFLVDNLAAHDRDTAGHTFPPSGTRHMAGHCTNDERMPWAPTRAGHRKKSFNTDTGSVPPAK